MPVSAAEMTAKSKKKKEIEKQIAQELPEASDEQKKAEIAKRLEKAMQNYTPRTKENNQPTPMETGRTRSRLEIRMGYEQKPCNPVSEEIVPYSGHKTSTPYRPEPTIEYPDEMDVESNAEITDAQLAILDSVADDPEYQQALKQVWIRRSKDGIVWKEESRVKEIPKKPYYVPPPSQEMQLWRAYRNVYEEKARVNEDKLRYRIASLEQQLMQLQDKYLPSAWSCVNPIVAKIEEQNKKIDKLEKDKEELYKQIKEQDKIIHDLEKQNQKLMKDLNYERNQ
jgi:hypothetical protein